MTTPKGHILLDGSTRRTTWLVEKAIRKLGYRPEDIRYLLMSHAHFDHSGSTAHFKKLSGAEVAVMKGDEEVLRSGGRTDFLFGKFPIFHFPPVTPSRVLEDGDEVEVGGLRFTALHTPGHTRGCTTWMTRIEDGGKSYEVVFPGSTSVNPGTRFTRRPSYPGIAEDYRKSLERLAGLRPDIFLCSHASFFDFDRKRELARTIGAEAYVDPEGYRRYVEAERREFEGKVRG